MMPSVSPSSSALRNLNSPSRTSPFIVSSTTGAPKVAAMLRALASESWTVSMM